MGNSILITYWHQSRDKAVHRTVSGFGNFGIGTLYPDILALYNLNYKKRQYACPLTKWPWAS